MKILALDVGDKWVGTALSDSIGMTCKPFKTTTLEKLESFLGEVFASEPIGTVVVGHPVTVRGRVSLQTQAIEKIFEKYKTMFSRFNERSIEWILWDERFSTKRALDTIREREKKRRKKEEKTEEHSIAAAFILQSYLDYRAVHLQH
jgi:putative Holliday junction resolvase